MQLEAGGRFGRPSECPEQCYKQALSILAVLFGDMADGCGGVWHVSATIYYEVLSTGSPPDGQALHNPMNHGDDLGGRRPGTRASGGNHRRVVGGTGVGIHSGACASRVLIQVPLRSGHGP